MILIGSQALKIHGFDRNPKDTDIIATWEEFQKWQAGRKFKRLEPMNGKMVAVDATGITEFSIAWPDSSDARVMEYVENDHKGFVQDGLIIPSLDTLYTLKMSHRYLKNSPHFQKTRRDIKDMRTRGCKALPWLSEREKATYTYSHPKLNQGKMGFFTDTYKYDHDSIHEAMKHLGQPAYTYFKTAEVMCSRRLFDESPRETQLYAVLEESYVLALERSQIPHPGVLTPRQSFEKALEKVCTSITSGWFREFAWENYDCVMGLYSDMYVARFHDGVSRGVVKDAGIQGLPQDPSPVS